MTVRVVTDSTADLPPEVARDLDIVVVPLCINFGDESLLDGVEISPDEFYDRLQRSAVLPTTSQPAAGVFAQAYDRLAQDADEILSLHISARLSGTYQSAVLGRDASNAGCRIEVVDSLQASMGFGLMVMRAARAAKQGASLDEILEWLKAAIPRARFFGVVDTLEYLKKGGRIGKAQALLGTLLNVKPLIACRDGETQPIGRVRTRRRALERMAEIAAQSPNIEGMAVLHSTTPEEAEALVERMAPIFPPDQVQRARFGPVLGTYLGPGALGVAQLEGGF